METKNTQIMQNNTSMKSSNIYEWIPDEYTEDEKNEIIRIINEYNSICLDILANWSNSDFTNFTQKK
jgi:hypothetical protein